MVVAVAMIVALLASIDVATLPVVSGGSASAAGVLPGAPFIVSVAGDGLGIDVTWVPSNAADNVVSYALTASAVPVAGVKVAHGCAAPTPTVVAGTNTAGCFLLFALLP